MRPSEAPAQHRDEVLQIIARYPVSNPRVFGSAARGEDTDSSDLDLVIDVDGTFSYFDMAKLALELEELLGCEVDIGTARSLKPFVAASAAADLRPIACIGEACGKILEIDRNFGKGLGLELTSAYSARNRYVHGYYDLDLEQVWDTVTVSVSELVAVVQTILNQNGQ